MFLCGCCGKQVPPRTPRKVKRVLREDGSIEREIPLCPLCKEGADKGVPFRQLRKMKGQALLTMGGSAVPVKA